MSLEAREGIHKRLAPSMHHIPFRPLRVLSHELDKRAAARACCRLDDIREHIVHGAPVPFERGGRTGLEAKLGIDLLVGGDPALTIASTLQVHDQRAQLLQLDAAHRLVLDGAPLWGHFGCLCHCGPRTPVGHLAIRPDPSGVESIDEEVQIGLLDRFRQSEEGRCACSRLERLRELAHARLPLVLRQSTVAVLVEDLHELVYRCGVIALGEEESKHLLDAGRAVAIGVDGLKACEGAFHLHVARAGEGCLVIGLGVAGDRAHLQLRVQLRRAAARLDHGGELIHI